MGLFNRKTNLQKAEEAKSISDSEIAANQVRLKDVNRRYADATKATSIAKDALTQAKDAGLDPNRIKKIQQNVDHSLKVGGTLVGERRTLEGALRNREAMGKKVDAKLKLERSLDKADKAVSNVRSEKSSLKGKQGSKNIGNFARKARSVARTGASATKSGSKKAATATKRGAKATAKTSKTAAQKTGRGIAAADRAGGRAVDTTTRATKNTRRGVKKAGNVFDKMVDFGAGSESKKKKKRKSKSKPRKITTKVTTKVFGK